MRFNSPCVQLARTSGRNHAAWLSAPANFPLDLRPIWRSAGLLAAGTSPLPWARRAHHHPRPFGHTSRQLHSRLCWFDSLLFAQTSFPPDPRPFPSFWPDGGINCRCAARVYQLGIVLKRYTPRPGGPTQRLRSPRSQITPCGILLVDPAGLRNPRPRTGSSSWIRPGRDRPAGLPGRQGERYRHSGGCHAPTACRRPS